MLSQGGIATGLPRRQAEKIAESIFEIPFCARKRFRRCIGAVGRAIESFKIGWVGQPRVLKSILKRPRLFIARIDVQRG
jgi:hypothetical protein